MKGFIGVTDNGWFDFLAQQPGIDEVNFWQPSGRTQFRAIGPGEPFFFKLHSPDNYIAGGAFLAHSTILPISLAWSAFGKKNGARSYKEMRMMIERILHLPPALEDYKIGCIILTQPFFFRRERWIPVPSDFSLNIVRGRTYDLTTGNGLHLWKQVLERLRDTEAAYGYAVASDRPQERYGKPTTILPRLGQGSFRVMVTDAYQRQCAITLEKTLPVLEATHIRPYSEDGPHTVSNGLLLRSDIHRLFDSGYVTVTPDLRFEVSNRIKEEYDNGEEYRALHGNRIYVPQSPTIQPDREFLSWHNERVFRE